MGIRRCYSNYLGQLLFLDKGLQRPSLESLVYLLKASVSGLSPEEDCWSSSCCFIPVRFTLVLSYKDPARLSR